MRPHHYGHQMPPGNFNQFRGPMPNFGHQPPRPFPPGMMPPGFNAPKGSTPRLDSFMQTANKFLATAQSFQPLIQQATPMIRNLPALWKLYKGFQSVPKSPSKEGEFGQRRGLEDDYQEPRRRDRHTAPKQNFERQPLPTNPRPSVPRIYQPPYDFD